MDWKTYYQAHTETAQQAVERIRSGDRVVVGHACGEPAYLLEAMVANAQAYENVEIVHMVAMGKAAYCAPEMAPHFRHNALFVGGTTRAAVSEGRGDFTPCFFSEVPSFFHTTLPVDVALIQVTPPDENGKCSLGVSVDYTLPALRAARTVIAQVNPRMPYTGGESLVDVTEITSFVLHEEQVIQLAPPKIGAVEEAIGRNVASLVKDGDTLQLGIGAIPDAVLLFLKDKKDLGIHSELFSDGVVDLAEAGKLTGRNKNLDRGSAVFTFAAGSRRLYDFIDRNPTFMVAPVDYVNDIHVISAHDNMISINNTMEVDLFGQVSAETMGTRHISGAGGQQDFVLGAYRSKGGKSFICCSSVYTDRQGRAHSRLVPTIAPGSVVTTTRTNRPFSRRCS